MTDLTQVFEDFKNSKVELDAEFWEEMNEKIAERRKEFAEKDRQLRYNPVTDNIYFDI